MTFFQCELGAQNGAPSKSSSGAMGSADQVSDMSSFRLRAVLVRSKSAASRDEVRIQHDRSVHVVGALADLLEKQFDGQLTHPVPRQTHRGTGMLLSGRSGCRRSRRRSNHRVPDSEIRRRLDNADGEQI